ncbi:hypothetical protein Tco_0840371 [Tanacetum coccineum]|uniref:Reverse transcriptase domain-containing protein n=1 Tax=Tanacetum coccineum TaxID=301880 RepID=A0ABQ5AXU6_9ASTR
MIKTSNRDTPFSLTYGMEAAIPVKIGMPSLRCAELDQVQNDEALLLNRDMLEEKRERAAIRKTKSKAKMESYYNAKVRSITFKPGDFVYGAMKPVMQRRAESWVQSGKGPMK